MRVRVPPPALVVAYADVQIDAANRPAALGKAGSRILSKEAPRPANQSKALVEAWRGNGANATPRIVDVMKNMKKKASEAELGIERLGRFLGLESTRTDTEGRGRTGPDVPWRRTEGGHTLAGVRDREEAGSQYRRKEDAGQAHDPCRAPCAQWPSAHLGYHRNPVGNRHYR
ncbi:MAG: hypothetical protein WD942_03275 [Dehalococcoidia bacterium]